MAALHRSSIILSYIGALTLDAVAYTELTEVGCPNGVVHIHSDLNKWTMENLHNLAILSETFNAKPVF